ncbi:MAG: hypothetical protein D6734_05745 [Candidatus Schekmanbacteria bacterium]|nr:MAG: hypothetical protein D6734_05745 [Candidatus Schekmanbacteria bacterium]
MKQELILEQLEELAEKLSIKVQYEDLKKAGIKLRGGSCRVEDENRIIIDKRLRINEKVEILANELSKLNLENVYIPPRIKSILGIEENDEAVKESPQ